jgi:single-strand DNA-binding protein
MKKIFVTGNVGRDPESRYAPNGESFVTFSLAVTTGPKDNQKTDWLEISCNGRTAETVQKWVKKGSKLLIEGTPSANAYINKEGKAVASLRVSASNIEFIGSRERSEEAGAPDGGYGGSYDHAPGNEPAPAMQQSGFNAPGPSLQADDIPF